MRIYSLHIYRIILPFVAFLYSLTTVGCSDKAALESVEQVLATAEEHPAEALEQIRSIDPNKLHGEHNRARYALAYSEALYYNRIDSDCDTLVAPLFEYYYNSDIHEERARAMFQCGWTLMLCNKDKEAMYALFEAEKSLEQSNNLRLKGVVSRTIGDIYGTTCLFSECLKKYCEAKEYFDAAKLDYHSMHILYETGIVYSKLRQYDKAIETLLEAKELSSTDTYESLYYEIVTELCFIYLQKNDIASCIQYFELINEEHLSDFKTARYYCISAIINAYIGNYTEAEDYVEQANRCESFSLVDIMYAEYWIAILQNDMQQALYIYQDMIEIQDNSFNLLVNNSISSNDYHYLEENIINERILNRRKLIINHLFVIITILIAIFGVYIFYTKNKEKQFRISTLIDQLESVKHDIYNKTSRIKKLSNVVNEKNSALTKMRHQLNDNIHQSLQNIDDLLSSYYSDSTKRVKQENIIAALDKYVREFAHSENGFCAVEQFVNQARNNIMVILRNELPSLNEKDYMLLCLIYADFSSNAICMFMGYDKNKLYKQKSKLKAQISNCNSKSKDLLLQYL